LQKSYSSSSAHFPWRSVVVDELRKQVDIARGDLIQIVMFYHVIARRGGQATAQGLVGE
jgi:hypothetical protein